MTPAEEMIDYLRTDRNIHLDGIRAMAKALGWTEPPDDDRNWFREDHGPVSECHLPEFILSELEHGAKVVEAAKALLADDDLALKIARRCQSKLHDIRYCDTCSARDDGISDYRIDI